MAQQLQNISIRAPAFKGLNTQDSPIDGDPAFAAVADNCIIDKYGRIGARKGFTAITSDATVLNGNQLRSMGFFEDNAGNTEILSAGNNKIFKGTTTLTDISPASYVITTDDWQLVPFNNQMYFFQEGYEPLVYDTANGLVTMTNHPSASGTPQNTNAGCAAYGRMWVAGTGVNNQTVFWSDLLVGTAWSGGTSGSINLAKVWPDGYDSVQAIAAHNGLLVIFGKTSTVIYQGAESPATMSLVDTIDNVGCIARDSVVSIGTDLLFLSAAGLQSFSRVLQQRSLPIKEVSRNIRDDFNTLVQGESSGLRAVYSPENAFYLLHLPAAATTYCFDTRGSLEDGSLRVTRWTASPFKCFTRDNAGILYVGSELGVGSYSGYTDNGSAYTLTYLSNPLTFGDPSKLKFLKKIIPTVISGASTAAYVKWSYDFSEVYKSELIPIGTFSTAAEYGIAEYGIAEYSSAGSDITKSSINTTGQGTVVTVGIEATISLGSFSLQEFNIQALLGRML